MAKNTNIKTVADNRKARFAYEVMDTLEAGLVLSGTEVKSLREGHANIQESYASVEGGEIWLINAHIPEYFAGNRFNHEPRRRRKLLLSKKEMARNPRQLIIYPEGTRRAPGAEPSYKWGIVELYTELGVPVVPLVEKMRTSSSRGNIRGSGPGPILSSSSTVLLSQRS